MRRLTPALPALLAVLAAAGCGGSPSGAPTSAPVVTTTVSPDAATASPGPSSTPPAASPAALSPTAADLVLTTQGAGAYQIGETLTHLRDAGLITDEVTGGEVCPLNTGAKGTGAWSGLQLWFSPDGFLDIAYTRSPEIRTPSGARVGMSLHDVEAIYLTRGEVIQVGSAKAYFVSASGYALFFELDITNTHVTVIQAGEANRLRQRFFEGSDC